MPVSPKITLPVRVSPETHSRLQALANNSRMKISELARAILERGVKAMEAGAKQAFDGTNKGGINERALAQIVESVVFAELSMEVFLKDGGQATSLLNELHEKARSQAKDLLQQKKKPNSAEKESQNRDEAFKRLVGTDAEEVAV